VVRQTLDRPWDPEGQPGPSLLVLQVSQQLQMDPSLRDRLSLQCLRPHPLLQGRRTVPEGPELRTSHPFLVSLVVPRDRPIPLVPLVPDCHSLQETLELLPDQCCRRSRLGPEPPQTHSDPAPLTVLQPQQGRYYRQTLKDPCPPGPRRVRYCLALQLVPRVLSPRQIRENRLVPDCPQPLSDLRDLPPPVLQHCPVGQRPRLYPEGP